MRAAPLAVLPLLLLAGCATPDTPLPPEAPPADAQPAFDGLLAWSANGTIAFTLEIAPGATDACRIDWAAAGPAEGRPAGVAWLVEDWDGAEPHRSAGTWDGNGNHGTPIEFTADAGPMRVERFQPEGTPWAARYDTDVQPSADAPAFVSLAAFDVAPVEGVELASRHLDEPSVWLNGTSARLAVACPGGNAVTFHAVGAFQPFTTADFSGGAGASAATLVWLGQAAVGARLVASATGSGHLAVFVGIDPEKDGRLQLDGPDEDLEWLFVPTHVLNVLPTPSYVGTQQGPGAYALTLDMVGGPVFGSLHGVFVDVRDPVDPWGLTPAPLPG